MAINYARLLALKIPEVEQTYTQRDTILYALGLGFGADPIDPRQLRFVYEDGLHAVPTFGVMLAYPGFWVRELETGIDWVKVLHGEQDITVHRPIPVAGTVVGQTRVVDIIDKGEGRGAIVLSRREVYDKATGDHLVSLDATTFCRGDGGFGGPSRPSAPAPTMPERTPDSIVSLTTLPQAALIYRLSGDLNPLHADPKIAAAAGFARPILHGLATFGIACHAILRACCEYQPTRLRSLGVRFTAPVYPGETVQTEIYRNGTDVMFISRVLERDVVVLQNGRASLTRA